MHKPRFAELRWPGSTRVVVIGQGLAIMKSANERFTLCLTADSKTLLLINRVAVEKGLLGTGG